MITSYNQRFYPNPFRYRKLRTIINYDEIFEDINKNIKPFLTSKFSEIEYYIDEIETQQSEIKLFRLFREKIIKVLKDKLNEKYGFVDSKLPFFTKPLNNIINDQKNLKIYEKNLRYLELPLQPLVNKNGYEIQTLSSDMIGNILEEIEYEYGFIYEYSSKLLPDPIDLWEDYALFNPSKFPHISHDDILESTYEIWDKVFKDLQKSSISLYKWIITGDLDACIIKARKPNFKFITKDQLLKSLEVFISITILLLLLKYCLLGIKKLIILKRTEFSDISIKNIYNNIKKEISFKKYRINQKTTKFLGKTTKIRSKIKFNYNLLRLIFKKSYI